MSTHPSVAAMGSTDHVSVFGKRVPCWAILVLIAVVTCLAYAPALSGGMLWDDNEHVTKPELRSLGGLYHIWFTLGSTQQYYPLLFSWFWLQYQLWGEQMVGYHVVNILLHLGAALLVYLILRRLKIPGALLATAIFALHPVQVESVAWVTEQKNTLSAVFYLGAMLMYLYFDETREWSWYALALGLFVAALLSKTVAVTLPPTLLLILWWQRGRGSLAAGPDDPPRLTWQRDVVPLLPFFVLSTLDGLLTMWVERKIIGAEGAEFELSLLEKPLVAGRAIWFYLEKLVWPVDLMFVYPRWNVDPAQLWQWLFPIAAVAALIALWIVRTRWRAPLAGTLFFVGTLFPVLGFLNVFFFRYSYVSDHFQYMACLGIIVLAASGIALALERLPRRQQWVTPVVCVVMVVTLAVLSWSQSRLYARDVIHLYETTIAKNPAAAMPHNNLGVTLILAGRPVEEAIEHFDAALRSYPNYADAHNNLGTTLVDLGRMDEAIEHLRRAVELDPHHAPYWFNLGNAMGKAGRTDESLQCYERAVQEKPDYAEALARLGEILLKTGRSQEAIARLQAAGERGSNSPKFFTALGSVLLQGGQAREAVRYFEFAVRLRPLSAEAHSNLGGALLDADQLLSAVKELKEALRLDPSFPEAHTNLANALSTLGRTGEAIEHLELALRVRPGFMEAHDRLAKILFTSGRATESLPHFAEVLRAKPDNAVARNNYGAALLNVGRVQEALEHFQAAVRIQPENVGGWTNLAVASGKLNRSDEAIAAGQKAIELAHSQGETALGQQLESWLSSYRAGQSAPANKPADTALPPP